MFRALVVLVIAGCNTPHPAAEDAGRAPPITVSAAPSGSAVDADVETVGALDILDGGLFADRVGRYAVAFPGAPTASTSTVDAPPLGRIVVHKAIYSPDRAHSYVVSYDDFDAPDGFDVDKALEGSVTEVTRGWTVESTRPTSLSGARGRELNAVRSVQDTTIRMRGRIYITKAHRQYSVAVIAKDGAASTTAATAFLSSFVIQP